MYSIYCIYNIIKQLKILRMALLIGYSKLDFKIYNYFIFSLQILLILPCILKNFRSRALRACSHIIFFVFQYIFILLQFTPYTNPTRVYFHAFWRLKYQKQRTNCIQIFIRRSDYLIKENFRFCLALKIIPSLIITLPAI